MRFVASKIFPRLLAGSVTLAMVSFAQAGTGTYLFNTNLSAVESGVPGLTAVNPLNQNSYGNQFLYGANRSVYNTSGTNVNAQQAGLTLDASSLVTATRYSLEMVVSLAATTGYRRLAGVSGRTLDSGYYVFNSALDIYPIVQGPADITAGTYNYLVLTVDNGTVKGYVNGNLDFTGPTTVMDGNAFDFFLDNTAGGGQGEYSDVSVGLIRLRDSVLSDGDVRVLAANPYATAPVPEPATIAALGFGALALLRRRRR